MNIPRLCETKKLHYGKYLYKLCVQNPIAPWFRTEFQRSGKLSALKRKLDEYQVLHDAGQQLYKQIFRSQVEIKDEEFFDAKNMYAILYDAKDYKIRVERWNGLHIYSNDKDFLLNIVNKMVVSVVEFWEPKTESINRLLNEKNIVLVDKVPEHPIKITFNYKRIDSNFSKWLLANTDKSTAGTKTINNISSGYAAGNYIFVRDDKVLSMVDLIVGHNIQRIERLVYSDNIDK